MLNGLHEAVSIFEDGRRIPKIDVTLLCESIKLLDLLVEQNFDMRICFLVGDSIRMKVNEIERIFSLADYL